MIWWILGAIALGTLIALGVVLTVSVLRSFRRENNTKILVADMDEFIKNLPEKEKHSMSLDDFEKCKGQQFISEFDPITNRVVQTKVLDKGMDEQIQSVVNNSGGYIIVGD